MKTIIYQSLVLIAAILSPLTISASSTSVSDGPTESSAFGIDVEAEMPHTLSMFSLGDGSVRAYTSVDGVMPMGEELYCGAQFTPTECPDGIFFVIEADPNFFLYSLLVNDEDVTDLVEDGVYHCQNVNGDVEVSAIFDVELAYLTTIMGDLPAGMFEVYTLQGSPVDPDHLTTGVYLVRRGTQTAKIYVR